MVTQCSVSEEDREMYSWGLDLEDITISITISISGSVTRVCLRLGGLQWELGNKKGDCRIAIQWQFPKRKEEWHTISLTRL